METPTRIEVQDGYEVCNNCGEAFLVLVPSEELKAAALARRGTTDEVDPMDPRCGVCR